MSRFVALCTSISLYFRWDLAYRFVAWLSPASRRELLWRALALEEVEQVSFRSAGRHWTAPLSAGVTLGLFRDGHFQGPQVDAAAAWILRQGLLRPGRDVVVDAGANIGTTCIPMALTLPCRILAIEPSSSNLHFLRLNVESNGLSGRFTIATRAIMRQSGRVRMVVVSEDHGGNLIDRFGTSTGQGFEEVLAQPFDEIAREHGIQPFEIAFVWSDTQGCEGDLMESGSVLWAGGTPLYAEVEPASLERQGELVNFSAIAARHFDRFIDSRELTLDIAGARVQSIAELEPLIESLKPEGAADLLFLPPGLKVS